MSRDTPIALTAPVGAAPRAAIDCELRGRTAATRVPAKALTGFFSQFDARGAWVGDDGKQAVSTPSEATSNKVNWNWTIVPTASVQPPEAVCRRRLVASATGLGGGAVVRRVALRRQCAHRV